MSNALAKVSDETGDMFLPADTPYDRDVLLEHLQAAVRAHREVRLELEERRLTGTHGEHAQDCAQCGRAIAQGVVQYTSGLRTLCLRCVRQVLQEEQPAGQ